MFAENLIQSRVVDPDLHWVRIQQTADPDPGARKWNKKYITN
jgi:hypothetical protein